MATKRETVDLSGYPDLVVIYLGMSALSWQGVKTFLGFGSEISNVVSAKPDGLLHHENLSLSLLPRPSGMFRQYWRDFESLEAWTRSMPHMGWWKEFLKDPKGTSFWHETYFAQGGMEAIYDNMAKPVGFMGFAPLMAPRGGMFSARKRLKLEGNPDNVPGASEAELYGG